MNNLYSDDIESRSLLHRRRIEGGELWTTTRGTSLKYNNLKMPISNAYYIKENFLTTIKS